MRPPRPAPPALPELTDAAYRALRATAHRVLRRAGPDGVLQPTALLHEAYLRLSREGHTRLPPTDFAVRAARCLREVFVDHVRRRRAARRGGHLRRTTLVDEHGLTPDHRPEALDLHEALHELALRAPRKARVVELRFFGGLSVRDVAGALHLSERAVADDWSFARAWLARRLRRPGDPT
ncbi:MAG: ECF-type sigma factor [Planctomycetota bacterium]